MARNSRKAVSKAGDLWKEKVHYVEFSVEDEVSCQDWAKSQRPGWADCLDEMLDSEWAVKITPPKDEGDWFVTGQKKSSSDELDGHSFTVKYPDKAGAVVLLYWVITSMLKDGRLDQVIKSKSRAWLE